MKRAILSSLLVLIMFPAALCADGKVQLSDHVQVLQGPVNGVLVERQGSNLVVYGDPTGQIPTADMLLLTHSRRDIVWSARKLVENGAQAIVPAAEADKFANVHKFWKDFTKNRYHDYAQQGTKIITEPMKIARKVKGGDKIEWQGVEIEVIDTPGYTRGAVSYIMPIDGIKYAFVGDLIYGNGQLFDLYSLQDAVTEAKIGGYHGYAGRISNLIASLRKVAALKPDIIVPARGPVIRNPAQAIELLIGRLRAVYRNYLSINAGKWYFKERCDTLAEMALGKDPKVPWMPWAVEINKTPPDWIVPISNSRLIMSSDRTGFLIDCGSKNIVDELVRLRETGKLKSIEGLFITHYHDDHTDAVNDLLKQFPCPVYACEALVQILENPSAFRLPAMTSNAIANIKTMPNASKMRWKQFNFTFYDFPGQTIYHDALFVEKDNAENIFFIGDSFTPSGIDDYCLLNRNILHQGTGYFKCLDIVRKAPADTLLINQHVLETFRFSPDQLDHMTDVLNKRLKLMTQLFPWDNPNYGIDERWARFTPYAVKAKSGQKLALSVCILNHSSKEKTFAITPHVPKGFQITAPAKLSVPPGKEGIYDFSVSAAPNLAPGVYVITADIECDQHTLAHWCEAIVEIDP